MRPWAAPAAAGAFGTGILFAGHRDDAWTGLALLCGGGVLLAVSALAGRGRAASSSRLLAEAGLLPPPRPREDRERILAAAGFPAGVVRERSPPVAPWRVAVALAALVALGCGWSVVRRAAAPDLGALEGHSVAFRGTASSDVRRFEFGWGVEAELRSLQAGGSWHPVSLRVWLRGWDDAPSVQAGMPVSGSGTLEQLDPGRSGFEDHLIDRGMVADVSVRRLEVLGPPGSLPLRVANAAREALRRGAFEALPRGEAGLLLGLSIGDVTHMEAEVDEDFRATGLGHLLAVSGSNVAMFRAPVLALSGALRAPRTVRLAVGGTALGFFVLLTRWEPSVLRASAMALLALVSVWAGRPRSTSGLLGVSVLLLLAGDPNLARALAFQLSVAATAGLAAMAPPLTARLRFLPRPVAIAVAATVAAQVAVTPLLLLHFGTVPTVTLLANVLAFPAVAPALFGGIAASTAVLVAPPVGAALAPLGRLPLAYLVSVADHMARFPLPSLAATGPRLPLLVAGLAVLVAWRLRRGRRPAASLAAVVAAGALAWGAAPTAGGPEALTVTFLDVGQGDAAVVRAPGGATVLVDAGPDDREVATDLARLGIRRVDLAVASHAHADHIEGFPAVLARYPVSLLIEPGCPAESPSYRRLLRSVDDEDVTVRHPRGGDVLVVGELRVEVLGPDECGHAEGPNDDSLVLRVVWGTATVLFPGDAEVPAQQDLLDDGDPVAADVLKVPHHGGDTSLEEFFAAVDARVAVVSTGENDYGHPVPSVLEALAAEGMAVYRTDEAGDVTVRFDGEAVLVESAAP